VSRSARRPALRSVSEGARRLAPREHPIGAAAAGILLFIAGLVVAVYTFEHYRAEHEHLSIAARAEGTVTGKLNGRPVVSFTLPGGDRVSFTATNVGRDDYPEGKTVAVLYRIDQPSIAIVDRPRARVARYVLLGALSLAVMAVGAYVARAARNHDARRAG
jgi:hypothetical protein